jgi:hypothetical protein
MDGYDDYASRLALAAKWLHPDGSVTDAEGGGVMEPDEARAEDYAARAPIAAKWLLPDGTVTSAPPGGADTEGPAAKADGNGIKVYAAEITYKGGAAYDGTSYISIEDEGLAPPLPTGTIIGFYVSANASGCDLSKMGVRINGVISESLSLTLRTIGTNQTYYLQNIISFYNTNLYFIAKKPDGRWEVLNWPRIADSAFADAVSAAKGGTGMTSGPAAKNFRMPVIGGTATNYASSKMKYVDAPTDDGGYAYLFILKEKGAEPVWASMARDLSALELPDAPPTAQAVKEYVDAAIAQAMGGS